MQCASNSSSTTLLAAGLHVCGGASCGSRWVLIVRAAAHLWNHGGGRPLDAAVCSCHGVALKRYQPLHYLLVRCIGGPEGVKRVLLSVLLCTVAAF